MQLEPEQHTQIELFASRAFKVRDIAIILGVSPDELEIEFTNETSPAFLSFERGRLKAMLDLRNNIYSSAISGSAPAQSEMDSLFKSQYANLKTINPDA